MTLCRRAGLLLVAGFALCAGTAPPLFAQPPAGPDTARQRAEIAKLSWMVGTWEGDAWVQRGPERTELRQHETVSTRLDGLALLVEGEGRAKNDPSKVLFRALGVVQWDHYAGGARLSSWTGEGHGSVSPMTITPTGFVWELTIPSGKVRYTATFAAGVWTEIGEWSPDGTTWSKFMEMNLKKTG